MAKATATGITLTSAQTITVDVPYTDPVQGAQTFQATWNLHKWSEYRKVVDAQQAGKKTDDDLLDDLVRLEGIKDSQTKQEIPHCDELVAAVMDVTFMRRPLILSWFAAQEGRQQAAAKN
ncbi:MULTISPECIES: hypothetical protein [unclassified Halomonas]|uniref:hypothetical protein n=1 Tax=unclassified Halomonas TaxID=2609666 RepID=UPI00209F524D|nr:MULTISPECIES: hypothetical protein [unclassified Halomonas]MCP1314391.1 hypothetical protein [Halomonas sp. 707D7]MCP1326054.1 hypothetical protein [Halomonas sp. 707D4]